MSKPGEHAAEDQAQKRSSKSLRTQDVGNFTVTFEKLGKGQFGTVYKAVNRETGVPAAAKVLSLKHRSSNTEFRVLKNVKHDNIVRLYDAQKNQKHMVLIMELCVGGDLHSYIERHGYLSEPVARRFLKQLVSGLGELYSRNIMHRDLKSSNLLLSQEDVTKAQIKIADFGFAKRFDDDVQRSQKGQPGAQAVDITKTFCGTPMYMAPERLMKHAYTKEAELFSIGVILYEMVFGVGPFIQARNLEDLLDRMAKGPEFPVSLDESTAAALKGVSTELPSRVSQDCRDLIESLMRPKGQDRLSFDEISLHPWVVANDPPAPAPAPAPIAEKQGTAAAQATSHAGTSPPTLQDRGLMAAGSSPFPSQAAPAALQLGGGAGETKQRSDVATSPLVVLGPQGGFGAGRRGSASQSLDIGTLPLPSAQLNAPQQSHKAALAASGERKGWHSNRSPMLLPASAPSGSAARQFEHARNVCSVARTQQSLDTAIALYGFALKLLVSAKPGLRQESPGVLSELGALVIVCSNGIQQCVQQLRAQSSSGTELPTTQVKSPQQLLLDVVTQSGRSAAVEEQFGNLHLDDGTPLQHVYERGASLLQVLADDDELKSNERQKCAALSQQFLKRREACEPARGRPATQV